MLKPDGRRAPGARRNEPERPLRSRPGRARTDHTQVFTDFSESLAGLLGKWRAA